MNLFDAPFKPHDAHEAQVKVRPNRAHRRAIDKALKAQKRRGQRAYMRHLADQQREEQRSEAARLAAARDRAHLDGLQARLQSAIDAAVAETGEVPETIVLGEQPGAMREHLEEYVAPVRAAVEERMAVQSGAWEQVVRLAEAETAFPEDPRS